jgi:nicotinamide mononucleotide transporter
MFFKDWLSNNYIEIFGAITGVLYVIFEIRQNIWLWPVGIITSAVYIWIFFTGKLYADMSLQGYYLVISILGWYWWLKGSGRRAQSAGLKRNGSPLESLSRDSGRGEGGVLQSSYKENLQVSRIDLKTGIVLCALFLVLYAVMWIALARLTDSPVPAFDSFITSLSIIATWMLARKIYEHWFLWIIVNIAAAILFFTRGLYPTVILYIVYCTMSFVGLIEWKKSLVKFHE